MRITISVLSTVSRNKLTGKRNACRVFVGKPGRQKQFGRPNVLEVTQWIWLAKVEIGSLS
jgi:hypothetical protein